jgi:hypothetical protein
MLGTFENSSVGRMLRPGKEIECGGGAVGVVEGQCEGLTERVVEGQWTVIIFPKTEFHNLCFSVNIS